MGFGRGRRRAVPQAPDGGEVERPAILQVVVAERQRRPHIGACRKLEPARKLGAAWECEAWRRDTDDGEALATEGDAFAKDRRGTRPPPSPERVTDQRHVCRPRQCVGVAEVPSDGRAYAEGREEAGRGLHAGDLLRPNPFAERVRP